jgi:uncharacterized protein YrrD
MLVLSQRLLSLPIISIQTGGQLGHIEGAIIDPRQLKVVAFYCVGPMIRDSPAILHSDDIREVNSIGIIVDGADDIMPADDLVRLKEVVGFKFKLEDKLVVEQSGHKVGKVAAYSVEATTFYILKIHVKPGILSAFKTTERIIDRTQIVEITPQKIVVKSAHVKEEKQEKIAPLPAIENPFRRASPQADATQTDQN